MENLTKELSEVKITHKGLRYNEGKLRYDLVHPIAQEGLVKVLTFGSHKYLPRNWEKGMSWSNIISSLKRHLAAIERGEDYDNETGLLHIDHLQCNAHFLSAYYKIYPQGDDRNHPYLNRPKIGLDVDEVLADWLGAWVKEFDLKVPTSWFFDYDLPKRMNVLKEEGKLNDFYLNLKPLIKPEDIPFEPHCYVTSRPVETEVTAEWIKRNNFPTRPVITVPIGASKVDVIKQAGVDIFVDDRYENFVELNNAGICTYLLDTPHNQRYNVGFKRIKSLKELV